jgi:DNA-binding transcriptional LysR family regulator
VVVVVVVVGATADIPLVSDPAVNQRPLFDEPLDLLVSPDHPLVGRASHGGCRNLANDVVRIWNTTSPLS